MKRGWPIVAMLILCMGGLMTLLLYGTGGRTARRGGGSSATSRYDSADTGEEDRGPAAAGKGGDARPGGGGAVDDDPNRIEGDPVTIRGRVWRNQKPVKGAEVSLLRAHSRRRPAGYGNELNGLYRTPREIAKAKRTQSDGRFEFTIPRRTALVLFADAPSAAFTWKLLKLPPEGDPEEIVLELGTGQVLSGKVIDENRKPVGGVIIEMVYNRWREPSPVKRTVSNEEGLFRFEGQRQGDYLIFARPKGYPVLQTGVNLPRTSEVLIELAPGGSIAGRVDNDQGEPIAGAVLTFRTGQGYPARTGPAEAVTDKDGVYHVAHAQPGPITSVLLDHRSYGIRSSRMGDIVLPTALIRVGEELKYDITLPGGVTVTGTTIRTGEGDAAVAGATVFLLRMSEQGSMADVATTVSGAEGRFLFPHVREGTYGLEAKARFAIRRARRAAKQGKGLTIDFFTDGETPPDPMRLEMDPTGTVIGRIEIADPKSYGGALGLTVAAGEDSSRYLQTDAFGFFVAEHIAPIEGATVQCWNPRVKSDPFDVLAGQVTKVTLNPDDLGGFVVIVKDADNDPLENALVQPMAESRVKQLIQNLARGNSNHRTDKNGRVVVPLSRQQRNSEGKQEWIVAATHHEHVLALSDPIPLPAEGENAEIELRLEAGGSISGRVELEGGGPLANVTVYARPEKQKDQPFETRPARSATSDIDGRFELRGIAREGIYRVSAATRQGRAKPIEARADDDGILLVFQATESISGFVVDEDKNPVRAGYVYALMNNKRRAGTLRDGRFQIGNLEPGSYELEVAPVRASSRRNYAGQGAAAFVGKKTGPVKTGTDDLVIEVSSGNRIDGRVLGAGRPLGGINILALRVKGSPRRRNRGGVQPRAITNGRGEFVLKGLDDRELELLAMGPGWQPATQKTSPGGGTVTIHLAKGEVIEGRVVKPDGKPLTSGWLSVWPISKELQARFNDWRSRGGNIFNSIAYGQRSSRTTGKGRFSFASLLPGTYTLYFSSDEGVAPQTTLQAGERNVVIQLQPALTLRGVVLDAAGNPPEIRNNQILYVYAKKGSRGLRGAQVNADGSFEIKGLPTGPLTLLIFGGGLYDGAPTEVQSGDLNVRLLVKRRAPRKPRR